LTVQGTDLRVEPASKLDPELRQALRAHKPELLALLATSQVAKRPASAVSIEPVDDAGRTAYRLVDAGTGRPHLVGLFIDRRWARIFCSEHDFRVVE
jgi:hypothetical protein